MYQKNARKLAHQFKSPSVCVSVCVYVCAYQNNNNNTMVQAIFPLLLLIFLLLLYTMALQLHFKSKNCWQMGK